MRWCSLEKMSKCRKYNGKSEIALNFDPQREPMSYSEFHWALKSRLILMLEAKIYMDDIGLEAMNIK